MAAQDDVPLIAEMDIEALPEQELNNLYVHDFYLLDHLIDINSKVKEQQDRMDAVRDEATRIFESFKSKPKFFSTGNNQKRFWTKRSSK